MFASSHFANEKKTGAQSSRDPLLYVIHLEGGTAGVGPPSYALDLVQFPLHLFALSPCYSKAKMRDRERGILYSLPPTGTVSLELHRIFFTLKLNELKH